MLSAPCGSTFQLRWQTSLGAVFTDPGKALTAVANIGEDMTDATRKESQKVVIAAVIAAQVLTTASMVGRVR